MSKITTGALLAVLAALILTGSASAAGFAVEHVETNVKSEGATLATGGANGGLRIRTESSGYEIYCEHVNLHSGGQWSPEALGLSFDESNLNCRGNTLHTNGCQLELHPGEKTTAREFAATFDVGPECAMTFTVLSCEITVLGGRKRPATGYFGGSGSARQVGFTTAATPTIEYTESGACPKSGKGNGYFEGSWAFKGLWGASESGIWPGSPTALYLAAEGGEGAPAFEAAHYPAGINNTWTEPFQFKTGHSGTVKCTPAAAETLGGFITNNTWGLNMARQAMDGFGCTLAGLPVTFVGNGCNSAYGLQTSNPFAGSYALGCQSGAKFEVKMRKGYGECSVTIPPQILGRVTYEATSVGGTPAVSAVISGKELTYTVSGSECPGPVGTYSDGVSSGSAILEAVS